MAAAPIVTVLALGGGAGETGLIQTAQTLPFLLFAIPAGMLADRMSRRSSAINIMAYGARPIGAAIGAFIGGAYGMELYLVAAAIGFLAQAAVILISPVVRLARLPEMLTH